MADEEEDPLDAFMRGIDAEVAAPPPARASPAPRGDDSDSDELDPMMSFVRAREAGATRARPDDLSTAIVDDDRPGAIEPLPPVDHASIDYPSFQRRFHRDPPEIAALTDADATSRLRAMDARVSFLASPSAPSSTPALPSRIAADPIPRPVDRFGQLGGVDAPTLVALRKMGLERPTPVQACAAPVLLAGRERLRRRRAAAARPAR